MMRAFLDRRSLAFRMLATLFALAHLTCCSTLYLGLLGLLMKFDGMGGNPLWGIHANFVSEREAWTSVGMMTFDSALSVIYGGALLPALWIRWGERPRVRTCVRFLAVLSSATAVGTLALIVPNTAEVERIEVLFGGAAMVATYCTCNVGVWIAFRGSADTPTL